MDELDGSMVELVDEFDDGVGGYATDPRGDDVEDIGTCQGCGSYGAVGSVCTRVFDGVREECGERL